MIDNALKFMSVLDSHDTIVFIINFISKKIIIKNNSDADEYSTYRDNSHKDYDNKHQKESDLHFYYEIDFKQLNLIILNQEKNEIILFNDTFDLVLISVICKSKFIFSKVNEKLSLIANNNNKAKASELNINKKENNMNNKQNNYTNQRLYEDVNDFIEDSLSNKTKKEENVYELLKKIKESVTQINKHLKNKKFNLLYPECESNTDMTKFLSNKTKDKLSNHKNSNHNSYNIVNEKDLSDWNFYNNETKTKSSMEVNINYNNNVIESELHKHIRNNEKKLCNLMELHNFDISSNNNKNDLDKTRCSNENYNDKNTLNKSLISKHSKKSNSKNTKKNDISDTKATVDVGMKTNEEKINSNNTISELNKESNLTNNSNNKVLSIPIIDYFESNNLLIPKISQINALLMSQINTLLVQNPELKEEIGRYFSKENCHNKTKLNSFFNKKESFNEFISKIIIKYDESSNKDIIDDDNKNSIRVNTLKDNITNNIMKEEDGLENTNRKISINILNKLSIQELHLILKCLFDDKFNIKESKSKDKNNSENIVKDNLLKEILENNIIKVDNSICKEVEASEKLDFSNINNNFKDNKDIALLSKDIKIENINMKFISNQDKVNKLNLQNNSKYDNNGKNNEEVNYENTRVRERKYKTKNKDKKILNNDKEEVMKAHKEVHEHFKRVSINYIQKNPEINEKDAKNDNFDHSKSDMYKKAIKNNKLIKVFGINDIISHEDLEFDNKIKNTRIVDNKKINKSALSHNVLNIQENMVNNANNKKLSDEHINPNFNIKKNSLNKNVNVGDEIDIFIKDVIEDWN